jgi:WD40 repeat protein/serine/threonine protein kinase
MPPDLPPETSKATAVEPRSVPETETPALGALPTGTPPLLAPSAHGPPTHRSPPEVGSTVKHYELLRKLGEGGMGTVYLARDTTLGRLVAIKVLQQHAGPNAQRFLSEAQATAQCRHDNIVVIYEVDELQGIPYMVLEYLEGRTLREWLAQRDPSLGPVSPSLAAELMLPVVRALACAHHRGIVHRDLKPENIFLTTSGRVVVLDFGIAKRLEADQISAITSTARLLKKGVKLTQEGAQVGTLPYMSPEQLRAEDVDARSDLWTMGILLYELVTGAHPLTYRSVFELLEIGDSDEPMPRVRDKRPDVGALGAIIDRCLEKPRNKRYGTAEELVAALEAVARSGKASNLGEDESPFAGLSAFQEADAERYVGRAREVVGLIGRLRNQPLVVVTGPSGTGKSSFVRAGVIPALKRSEERWEALILRPGRRPLAALADVIAQFEPATPRDAPAHVLEDHSTEALRKALSTQPGLIGTLLRARCRRGGGRHRILLFVDQFEELYTLGADAAERAAFVACLEGVADDASSPLRVVLSLRSDFLYRMADEGHFTAEVTRGLLFLRAMGRDGLRQALTRPLEVASYRFENEAMVEAMVEGLERTKSPLPLLQFTAAKLWEARDRTSRLLTQESYEQLGGVAGALSAHANAVLSALSETDRRLCRAVLLRLCTPERTRAVVSLADLRELAAEGGAVEQVIHRLSDARLVLVEMGGEREGTTVELCHESLIDSWDKLKQWLAESEQDAQFVARLAVASQQWEASQESEGLLWRDRAAREAAEWLTRRRAEQAAGASLGLSKREERFLVAVVALSERGRRRRQRILAGVLATVSVIAVVVSLLAIGMKRAATRADQAATEAAQAAQAAQAEARQARNAARMAAASDLEVKDPTTALALLREIEPPGTPRGWADLVSSALQNKLVHEVRTWSEPVYSVAFSPDGQRIVAALQDGTARVWNPGDPAEPVVLRGHESMLRSAAFSPEGMRIVTASGDKTARVGSADGSGVPVVFRGHEGPVISAGFSPDGTHIVTASEDKTARVWKADGTGQPIVLRAHEAAVTAAAYSPDGQRIVTASFDQTARVWRADGTGTPIVLRGHEDVVHTAAFSPDGQRIVTGSADTTVRVWKADGTGDPIVLRGHENRVNTAAFSPDGTHIATASLDQTARVWDIDGRGEPLVLRGHENWVYSAAWSPDGASIATGGYDQTTRIFRLDSLSTSSLLHGHEATINEMAFSHDGQRIVTASDDRTARVWRADGAGQPVVLRGHEGAVTSAAFSRDGERIVTGSGDNTARIWRADGAGQPVVLRGHEKSVTRVAFSPDGARILTGSADQTARVWRADGTGEPVVLRGHERAIVWATFSPDGKHVVTRSTDNIVRVWNADGSGEAQVYRGYGGFIHTVSWSPDSTRIVSSGLDRAMHVRNIDRPGESIALRGHEQAISCAAFSPDGKRIVTASDDRTARVWNADGSGEPVVLRGHEQGLWYAAFSPDGEHIITGGLDETARVWNADGSGEPAVLSTRGQAVSTASWSQDGTRVVGRVGKDRKNARVWPLPVPLRGTDDPRLWSATPYCMSIARRIELLNVPEARARADQEACERRVKAAGAAATKPAAGE